MNQEPIIAIASATGMGGIGVIRVSGKSLLPLSESVFGKSLSPRKAEVVKVQNQNKESLDTGIGIYFPGPNSFTGEDVLEFQGHGGTVVLNLILQRILEIGKPDGLRLAKPGEFSERAFLNNKIDLTQAEAIADLIEATSEVAVKSANRTLSGEFSRLVNQLVHQLTNLRILVEATLDFPEEEIDFLENANAKLQWESIQTGIHEVLKKSRQGALLRNGAVIVLVGEPNVGKSTLLNQLAGQDIAIVTPIPGTTRDRLKETIHIQGVPIQIVDTAGLRETDDPVEKIGVERSWEAIHQSDLIIFMRDCSENNAKTSNQLKQAIQTKLLEFNQTIPLLEVWNKMDECKRLNQESNIQISAKLGLGLDPLKNEILRRIGFEHQTESSFLARTRHIHALQNALEHIDEAGKYLSQGNATLELFAEELRIAQDHLGEITGKMLPDELLGKIFGSFCIGK